MEPDFSIKFFEIVSDSKRGILLNNAKVMASSIVDLPDPVGPVIANNPAWESGGDWKFISHSHLRQLIFLILIFRIFIANRSQQFHLTAHRKLRLLIFSCL